MPRKNYIHNLKPVFNLPQGGKKISNFIYYAIKKAFKIDVARSKLTYTLLPMDPKTGNILPRFRRLNEHRACAMRAIVPAMLYYCNTYADNLVEASIEKLSDECGLSTFSHTGKKSITRASRLIKEFLEPMGFVKCKKNKKNFTNYAQKKIFLTSFFFLLLDISMDELNNFLQGRVKGGKKCKKKGRGLFISLSEQKKIFKLDKISARNKILNALINFYTVSELTKIGPKRLKERVDIEYNNLLKINKKK